LLKKTKWKWRLKNRLNEFGLPCEAIDPEKAKDMMDKLQAGQKNREDQNKFLEELDTED
jgi:hypothetical protein